MEQGEKTKRWTILDMPVKIRSRIVKYAKANGYRIPRAIKELTEKELEKWEKTQKKDEQ